MRNKKLIWGAGTIIALLAIFTFQINNSPLTHNVATTTIPSNVQINSLPPDSFNGLMEENITLLDIRTPEEYASGHLEQAQNIDFYSPSFQAELSKLDRTKPYAIYCRSGNRTGQTLTLMRSLGFVNVTELAGGIIAWQQTGHSLCNSLSC